MRMLIVGYCFGIRSERRLCDEVHLNLAYRWFCRLGLDGDVPDHSTFSKNRHGRFRESDLLRKLFETVVARSIKEGVVGGEAFAVDASMIVADACRRRGVAKVEDLHGVSGLAQRTALEVLAANGVETVIQRNDGVTPTPADSYTTTAGGRPRRWHRDPPSPNPPEDGGFKYNPPNGGPADTDVTAWVQDRANELLRRADADIKRVPFAAAIKAVTTRTWC